MFKSLFLVLLSSIALTVYAAPQEYLKEYTYRASEKDSLATSRENALAALKAELLGELGTYIHSDLSMNQSSSGSSSAEHKIQAISLGFIKADVLEERWDGFEYFVKAKLIADPKAIAEEIKGRKSTTSNEEAIQRKLAESHQAILALRQELSQLKSKIDNNSKDDTKVEKQKLEVKNHQLESYQYLEQANNYYLGSNGHNKDIQKAKDFYVKAAQLGNKDAWFFIDYLYQIEIISKNQFQKLEAYRQTNSVQNTETGSQKQDDSVPGWGEWVN